MTRGRRFSLPTCALLLALASTPLSARLEAGEAPPAAPAPPRAALQGPPTPCRTSPLYRAFDYWIGTWDVYPTGAPRSGPASENVVTLDYGGCVLQEHWKGVDGSEGTSLNIYDSVAGQWVQTWADSGGRLRSLRGGPDAKGNLVFHGERPPRPGETKPTPTRLSFFREGPDRVRQLGEASTDGGTTWVPTFDFTYYRRGRS